MLTGNPPSSWGPCGESLTRAPCLFPRKIAGLFLPVEGKSGEEGASQRESVLVDVELWVVMRKNLSFRRIARPMDEKCPWNFFEEIRHVLPSHGGFADLLHPHRPGVFRSEVLKFPCEVAVVDESRRTLEIVHRGRSAADVLAECGIIDADDEPQADDASKDSGGS